ncbi:dysbindin protein homolog [Sycon ciliatum]|uniref:dysbindin protein homolog n=1 Tax=Sycon ciliatum TaxID=27933 RepID=UPI0031F71838
MRLCCVGVPREQLMGKCDVDACSFILSKYQDEWSHMATDTQQCANTATEADNQVQTLLRKALAQQEALVSFQRQLDQMPGLISTLASAQRSVATLSVNMTQTEAALGRLETLIDRIDLQRRQDTETRLFERHQKSRQQELDHLKASVADAERRKADLKKQAELAKQRERQAAFEAVHQQEIKMFKEKGEIETITRPRGASSASVDEYQCIDDSGEFENFLAEEKGDDDAGSDSATTATTTAAVAIPEDSTAEDTIVQTAMSEEDGDEEDTVDGSESTAPACEVAVDADPTLDPSLLVVASPVHSPTPDQLTDGDD